MRNIQRWMAIVLLLWPVPSPLTADDADGKKPIPLTRGVHLLLDDHLIAHSAGVERKVTSPQRFLDGPVVTGSVDHQNWQPFFTVIHQPHSPSGKPFRMWYNVDVVDDATDGAFFGKTGYLESADGIHWPGPYERLNSLTEDGRVRFGASVLDDGPTTRDPTERYKMLYFDAGHQVGPRIAFSADGRQWTLPGRGKPIHEVTPGDDIWSAGYDPLRQRYFLIGKKFGPHTWTNAEGQKVTASIRRYFTSFSPDFKTWSDLQLVFSPDEKDSGITQWYGSAGYLTRGSLIISFLRELRDDLSPEGVPAAAVEANTRGKAGLGAAGLGTAGGSGMGYTVLAWSRDGVTWQRDRYRDKFFEPDSKVGAWDHSMAWVGSAVPAGDDVFLYYAGYRWGHKYHHSLDRQLGVVKIKRDRYVARQAGDQPATFSTPTVALDGETLLLNTDASHGEVRVRITDTAGQTLAGFGYEDCRPITDDSLDAPVEWAKPIATLRGRPVRLEVSLRNAQLFAFEVR